MRAVSFSSFGGPEVLEVIDAPIPVPGAGLIRIAVRACGVNPFDYKQRRGIFGGTLPIRVGVEVAGVVDAIGANQDAVAVGDHVYGFSVGGGAADFALSSAFAPIPAGLDFVTAASMPVAVETAYRVLDLVGVSSGAAVVVNGASGAVGQAIVQIAAARGAGVIGTASEANHPLLVGMEAQPVTYGAGLAQRVRALGISRVDAAIDAGGGGVLADLVELTGDPQQVVTIVPDPSVQELGVRISGGNSAFYGLRDIAALLQAGRYAPPTTMTFPMERVDAAQERSETGHPGGVKFVLTL